MLDATRRERSSDGFTLIELLVVVVIIGILIAIAIPLYLNYKKGANDKSAAADLRGAIGVLESCNSDVGSYPTAITANTANGACTGKQINTGSATTLNYYPSSASSPTNYLLLATTSTGSATGGVNGYYCYASAAGGSIVKKTNTQPTAYAASC